ncbi:protein of unknown function [Magnetospirillum sp. XM-1]|nr:protein of unknown function [Magnetospirillum sp. XM-1]
MTSHHINQPTWERSRRPLGSPWNKIPLTAKHASVAAFEGYAGSSRSGFLAEVEAERHLGQLDDLLVYFDDHHAGNSPSGPAGPRIVGALDAAAELGSSPVIIADRGRVRALLSTLPARYMLVS